MCMALVAIKHSIGEGCGMLVAFAQNRCLTDQLLL